MYLCGDTKHLYGASWLAVATTSLYSLKTPNNHAMSMLIKKEKPATETFIKETRFVYFSPYTCIFNYILSYDSQTLECFLLRLMRDVKIVTFQKKVRIMYH